MSAGRRMSVPVWVRHTWKLAAIDTVASAPRGYQVAVQTELDAETTLAIVVAAYESDDTWRPEIDAIRQRMARRIHETLGQPDAAYLAARRAGAIAAVSGVAVRHWTGQNLLTGICVHPDHQRRGVGTALLGASLMWLRDQPRLAEAVVYTELDSVADKHLYPRYGSSREIGVVYPGALDGG